MQNSVELLFSLLSCCLSSDRQSALSLPEELPDELYTVSTAHDCAHLVALALQKQGRQPEKRYLKQLDMAIFRHARLDSEQSKICATLEKANIPYLPLKGAVVRAYYPEPWMRTSCDIDILVHAGDLKRASELLQEELSYVPRESGFHHLSLLAPNRTNLELHFSVCAGEKRMDPLLERVWEYAVPASDGSCRHVLTEAYFLFHLIAHAAHHFKAGGCGIKPFSDLWVLKDRLKPDQAELELLFRSGLMPFYQAMCRLTEVWFAGAKHTKQTLQMQSYLLSGGTYGTVSNQVLSAQTKTKSKTSYFFHRLFPPYRTMCIRNPSLKKLPFLLPVFWCTRILSCLSPKKAGRAKHELRIGTSITETQKQTMAELLSDLGLSE